MTLWLCSYGWYSRDLTSPSGSPCLSASVASVHAYSPWSHFLKWSPCLWDVMAHFLVHLSRRNSEGAPWQGLNISWASSGNVRTWQWHEISGELNKAVPDCFLCLPLFPLLNRLHFQTGLPEARNIAPSSSPYSQELCILPSHSTNLPNTRRLWHYHGWSHWEDWSVIGDQTLADP